MLFADLLSLHLFTFSMFVLYLFMSLFFSRCMLELKFVIYHRAASLPSQASYAVLAEESLTRPGFLQTLPTHQLHLHFVAKFKVQSSLHCPFRDSTTITPTGEHTETLATFPGSPPARRRQ